MMTTTKTGLRCSHCHLPLEHCQDNAQWWFYTLDEIEEEDLDDLIDTYEQLAEKLESLAAGLREAREQLLERTES